MANALVWFRRDLRLADNPALQAALDAGYAPIPVYIHAPHEEAPWAPGAASHAWLYRSLGSLADSLAALGSRLIVRSGSSLAQLQQLIVESGAEAVYWNRLYEPAVIARDKRIKETLRKDGFVAESFNAALLAEPWTVATQMGEPYRVFTPFWKNASQRLEQVVAASTPRRLPMPPTTVASASLDTLELLPKPPQPRWDAGFWAHWQPGEDGAMEMLDAFVEGAASGYKEQRNYPDRIATSKLSPHLHFGEISPRQIIERMRRESWPAKDEPDIRHFYSELGWREFSHHLLYHYPHTAEQNLNPRFERFPWAEVNQSHLTAWQQGRTGVPMVDAGMRELWHTGWMHNRVRMVVASFLCKNLRYHWRHGADWFWDTLVDADLANNTQGWQWTAGTGADAAPYFRIFNPVSQTEKFDQGGRYIRRWLPELAKLPDLALAAPWEHAELLKRHAPDYPGKPIIDLRSSREEALAALAASKP